METSSKLEHHIFQNRGFLLTWSQLGLLAYFEETGLAIDSPFIVVKQNFNILVNLEELY